MLTSVDPITQLYLQHAHLYID